MYLVVTLPYDLVQKDTCCGLKWAHPKFIFEALAPSVTVFGDRANKRSFRLNEVIMVGS